MKSKTPLTTAQKVLKAGEKEIRKKIESELRSRSVADGAKPSTSTIEGSKLHSQTQAITPQSVHMIMRKLKK